MMKLTANNWIFLILAVLLAVVVATTILDRPDQRSGAQKIGDAINELPNGVDKAARQLEDRTPGDKLRDAVNDTKNDLKDSTNHQ